MRKLILFSLLVLVICMALVPTYAEVTDYDIHFGKEGVIKAKLIDDFSESSVSGVYWDAIIKQEEGVLIFDDDGKKLCDTYDVTVSFAEANLDLIKQADYMGVKIKNLCDDEIYFGLQGRVNGTPFLMNPDIGEKEFIILDLEGRKQEVWFSSGANVYERNAIIIPKDFEGYVLIPLDGLVNHYVNDPAQENVNFAEMETFSLGFHVSIGNVEPLGSTYVSFTADDFFVYTGALPEYAGYETPTPAPTNTPAPTKTPTEKPQTTVVPKDNKKTGDFNPLYIIIPVAVVVIVVLFVLIVKKSKK